jgi:hypothetical protein
MVKVGRKIYIKINTSGFHLYEFLINRKTYREAVPTLKALGLEGTVTYVPNWEGHGLECVLKEET